MIASLSWLTNFGMLEQGQTIEIEPVYISLLALALISWLLCWQQRRSPWLMWLVPSVFLGVGLLAKGPAHLLFFYVLVAAVLRQSGRLREFLHPAHIVAIIIMWAIFAAWAVPYVMELKSLRAIGAKSFWELPDCQMAKPLVLHLFESLRLNIWPDGPAALTDFGIDSKEHFEAQHGKPSRVSGLKARHVIAQAERMK